ncbi:Deoxyribodipyrimidine photo-lyase [Rosistilla carotiformis]|uniref:Deoxyribodipyrimidine photo-lyase n=1 Tax=Rosistilla carotiformis TaxID=2528017 RepID=A0A518JNC3_9BACT|nr:deoxyribodipyrimidine photolyase [Rosistilla carotiformis]QDV67055.1 Deoxyribodipyrimidine photo-lyase [Rosistilla carotiformis]
MTRIPELRIRDLNAKSVRPDGQFVLYWMIANRRTRYNFSLQHAASLAQELGRPLIVLEALRCDYPCASDRLHRFVLQGMADNRAALADANLRYYAYVEPSVGEGRGLLQQFARDACAIVTDDFPCFFIPAMLRLVSRQVDVAMQAVDSNGLLPIRATEKVFARAHDFRRFLQKNLKPHLSEMPKLAPLQGFRLSPPPPIPDAILERWPEATDTMLEASPEQLSALPIDHEVGPAAFDGGSAAAAATLDSFISQRLPRYGEDRNQPESDASSGLSPYLHFGQISTHDVFAAIVEREQWSPDRLAAKASGSREGWWGMSEEAESFLDELITWREVGFNFCTHRRDYDRYESLPDWAQQTLGEHADDEREFIYSLEEFEAAKTHDDLWNAAQRQLVREGRMHNYLRMLWGKKILEWTPTPQAALQVMLELNNKYAVDGRDPNSYSGIFWVLGRYDRAWQERDVFGKIRFMSSENTARKLKVKKYLQQYAADASTAR